MRKLCLFTFLFCTTLGFGQEFDSRGQVFWLTFMENLDLTFNAEPSFAFYVSAEESGTATVDFPATGLVYEFLYNSNLKSNLPTGVTASMLDQLFMDYGY